MSAPTSLPIDEDDDVGRGDGEQEVEPAEPLDQVESAPPQDDDDDPDLVVHHYEGEEGRFQHRGGAVLAYVGMRTLWTSSRSSAQAELAELADRRPHRRRTAYLAGLATNLANPKAGVFAISLLPAFAGTRGFLPTVSLGLVWSGVTASWYLLFVLLIARGRTFVTRPRAQRALGFVSGSVLVAVGLGVALGI